MESESGLNLGYPRAELRTQYSVLHSSLQQHLRHIPASHIVPYLEIWYLLPEASGAWLDIRLIWRGVPQEHEPYTRGSLETAIAVEQ